MRVETDTVEVATEDRLDVHVITDRVREVLAERDVADGLVLVSTGHTTAAVSTNEAEERLLGDMLRAFADLVPPNDWYFHDQHHTRTDTQPNAYGHILAAMVKRPVLLVVEDGEPRLGTYEDVLLFEFDGPQERGVDVSVLS